MFCCILKQALGIPTGSQSPFRRWSVDAVTVKASIKADPQSTVRAIRGLSESMEAVVRSCSNLMERLNRSYYYYLMISTDAFVPIEIYLVPVVLVLLTILLKVRKQGIANQGMTICSRHLK